uniref:uncharacterized protein LOC125907426 n=1 Tax=Anopheles coluzzii TaxID=1518534 RepID=UPI0020FFDF8C|nr:uncharacterized protein LOC125907426 [Anopheles coluzzii]
MRNHSGPRVSKRRLLAGVSEAIIRYGAPIWAEATDRQCCRRMLASVQRPLAQRVVCGFRSMSYSVAVLMARLIPHHLLIKEDARCHQRYFADPEASRAVIRREERAVTLEVWQREWHANASNPGASRYARWAHRLIPEVHSWMAQKRGEVDFHLAQILSGHGFFREFLHVCGFAPSPECPECTGSVESVVHVLFHCPRFAEVRRDLLEMGVDGSITEENLGQMLLKSSDSWIRIQEVACRITTVLQVRWREDEAALNTLANSTSAEATVNAEQMQDDPAAARRAARNRQARARRAQERVEQLGDVELASAFRQLYGPAASDATSSIPAAVPLLLEATATVDPTPVAAAVAVAEAATSSAAEAAPRVAPEVAPFSATTGMAPPSSPSSPNLSPRRRRQAQR